MARVGEEYSPATPQDQLLQRIEVVPPVQGLYEGVDSSLPDFLFHVGFMRIKGYEPIWSPDLENIRVASGTWATRLGMSLFRTIPGSGAIRLLAALYTDVPQRIRLAFRGDDGSTTLYDYLEGTDVAFNVTTGGTSLGGNTEPYFNGVTENNTFYFTDRAQALRKYQRAPSSGNQVRAVALPVAPAAAPLITPRTYRILEYWSGTAPYGWTVQDSTSFNIEDQTASFPPPGGGNTVRLHVLNSSGKSKTITKNVSAEDLSSHQLAFWARLDKGKTSVQFQFGLNAAQDYNYSIKNNGGSEWLPAFVPIGDLPTWNFKRFQCVDTFDGDGPYISQLSLPGRLEGQYRWFYTHYDPTLARESAPSAISNGGQPTDFSAIGKDGATSTARAFQKAAGMTFTSDSGADATTTKIRIYRNGGVPELTVDSRGNNVWLKVGEVFDQSTTLTSSPAAGAQSFTVASAANLATGDALVLDKGTVGLEEVVVISSVVGTTINLRDPLTYAHTSTHSVQVAFIDNVANEFVDVTATIDVERNDPPAAAMFVARSPEGRLWLFNYSGYPTGVAVSNRATPLRPLDYEVFPDGVDPLTRRSLIQGWRFQIGGDQNEEEIIWGGFFQDRATILTRRNLYIITAHSQLDWGPLAVRKVHSTGCIARDTVKEVNGVLYWLADGPRVMKWNGQGEPENISHLRVNVRLNAADKSLWKYWFANSHAKKEGLYYSLFYGTIPQPTNLVATAISTSEIDLTWADNSTNEDGFAIERSLDGLTGWTQIATVAANVTSYQNTGLAAATTYYYRIRAFTNS